MKRLFWTRAAAMAVAVFASGAAFAQTSGDEAALRREQAEQYAAMFEAPDDPELMLRYAMTSIRLQDYEAAITTLERLLIFNPDQPRVRVELGAAYFRIGSYAVARHYFQEVLDDAGADQALKDSVGPFVAEIDQRTRKSYVTGRIGLSGVFTTNANNGPDDANVLFLGAPAVIADPNATSQTDVGVSLDGQISHVYDLGGPSDDKWRSDLGFVSTRYADTSDGALDALVFRTGPQLSLDEERYGVKARPYVEVTHIRFGNDPLQTSIGGGVEVTNTIDQKRSFFSDLRVAWVDDHRSGSALDGINVRGNAGINYFHDEDWSFRGLGLFEFDGANDKSAQSYEFGVAGLAMYRYDSGLEFADRRWLATGGVRAVYRIFDEPGLADPARTRDDVDLRFLLSNTAYLMDGFALYGEASYLVRESNIVNFDLENFTGKLGVQFRF